MKEMIFKEETTLYLKDGRTIFIDGKNVSKLFINPQEIVLIVVGGGK